MRSSRRRCGSSPSSISIRGSRCKPTRCSTSCRTAARRHRAATQAGRDLSGGDPTISRSTRRRAARAREGAGAGRGARAFSQYRLGPPRHRRHRKADHGDARQGPGPLRIPPGVRHVVAATQQPGARRERIQNSAAIKPEIDHGPNRARQYLLEPQRSQRGRTRVQSRCRSRPAALDARAAIRDVQASHRSPRRGERFARGYAHQVPRLPTAPHCIDADRLCRSSRLRLRHSGAKYPGARPKQP